MSSYRGRDIDENGVPLIKREHPEYKRLYKKLQSELAAPNSIDIFCAHEAGHLIFFRRAGFTQFKFYGPTMTYDAINTFADESERYNYFIAAVRTPEANQLQGYNDDLLNSLARGAAAGEVFNEIRQRHPPVPIDKSSDFDGFDLYCRNALRKNLSIGYDAEGRWKRARKEVEVYLGNRINENEIKTALMEVKYGCFGIR
jgi:hypothetical protein